MDTVSPTLPPPPPLPASPSRRPVVVAILGVVVVVALLAGIAMVVTVPRVAFLPGSVTAVSDRIEVTGAPTFDDDGEIMFVTVRFDDDINLIEFIDAGLDESVDFVGRTEFFGEQTPQENREANLEMMRTSRNLAVLVALDQLGYDVYEELGAGISGVEPGQPADGVLEPGDVITAIDGEPVRGTDDLVRILSALEPGDEIELTVIHPDRAERTETLELGARPDGSDGGFLGVATSTAVDEKPLPLEVELDTGEVGGNSAGLALTLSVIDALTEGDLVGGRRVAVTGTIDVGGTVGLIGGIKQKAVAVDRADADVFLVPTALAEQARRHAGDTEVIGVDTLADALEALADLGGNARELALPALADA